MRLFVLILTLIFGISELSAQAIPLISPDRDMTFTKRNTLDEDSAYFFIRTTSVADEADGTAYYFNVNIDTAGGGCETDTTFMGRKALLLDDIYQTYVFFNDQQDSIFIRTDVSYMIHGYSIPGRMGNISKHRQTTRSSSRSCRCE